MILPLPDAPRRESDMPDLHDSELLRLGKNRAERNKQMLTAKQLIACYSLKPLPVEGGYLTY